MVYVTPYEEKLREGLEKAISEIPDDHKKMIDKITDTICESIQERVRSNTQEYLAASIQDDIFHRAAKVAESMLMNALAGEDKEIRNLFGFSDYYMKSLYLGKLPTQWALIDAIAKRNPKIFGDERIKQQEAQISDLQRELTRVRSYWEGYEVVERGSDYMRLEKKQEASHA